MPNYDFKEKKNISIATNAQNVFEDKVKNTLHSSLFVGYQHTCFFVEKAISDFQYWVNKLIMDTIIAILYVSSFRLKKTHLYKKIY